MPQGNGRRESEDDLAPFWSRSEEAGRKGRWHRRQSRSRRNKGLKKEQEEKIET